MSEWLYVKNWDEFQHYKKRNPPWIKLHRRLLRDGDFHRLTEIEQWQLVRIWLVAADEHPGGWVPNDAGWLRRMIASDKQVPVETFVKGGWLTVQPASAHASALASTDASAADSTEAVFDPLSCPPEEQRNIKNLPSFLPTPTTDVEGRKEIDTGNILKEVDAA